MKKSFAVVLAGTFAGACVQAQVVLPGQSLGELRSVLKQSPHSAAAASPRQLSPQERAELRRQLSQQPQQQQQDLQQQQQQQGAGQRDGKGA